MAVVNRIPKILFFDSGMGGLSVFTEVRKLNDQAAYYYLFDHEGFPYGEKSEDYLVTRVKTLLSAVCSQLDPDVIVIACNTASTVVLDKLRAHFTMPIVGVVPAIKTAGQLSCKRKIALLATPGTVKRSYTQRLIDNFASDCQVLRIGSLELVRLAESCLLEEVSANPGHGFDGEQGLALTDSQQEELQKILQPIISLPESEQPDVLVLGCTHFPLVKGDIARQLGPNITLVDSGAAIARRVQYVLAQERESLELEAKAIGSDPLLNPNVAGAWLAWYTGVVDGTTKAQFEATFSYFGFRQINSLQVNS